MCGICGVYGNKNASNLVYLGLYALQHRGEESSGIVAYDGRKMRKHHGMGLVSDIFDTKSLRPLRGNIAVGHVRYSTTGSSVIKNVQPLSIRHKGCHIAISHNGNLTNAASLRSDMEESGSLFNSTMDSEVIMHLLARMQNRERKDCIIEALSLLKGAFSLVMMFDDMLVAARDPLGFRPLCIGKFDGTYVAVSETCALDLMNAKYIRDVKPGEIVFIDKNGLTSRKIKPGGNKHAFCIFEHIYFARPDSDIFGENVYLTRKRLGVELAREAPVDCDIVMPIPDSGTYAALGFAQESKIPLEMGMVRNHYIGRTFIQPAQKIRDFNVRIKLNPIREVLKGKRVVIVEDSIVRGTTSRTRVRSIRQAGAKEIHMRVSCPPLVSPCYYGIDFPTKRELIASNHSVEEIRDFIGLDSLKYLSFEGMMKAMPLSREEFCAACFNKKYPTDLPRKISKNILEK